VARFVATAGVAAYSAHGSEPAADHRGVLEAPENSPSEPRVRAASSALSTGAPETEQGLAQARPGERMHLSKAL
jgi:hypothetical protein